MATVELMRTGYSMKVESTGCANGQCGVCAREDSKMTPRWSFHLLAWERLWENILGGRGELEVGLGPGRVKCEVTRLKRKQKKKKKKTKTQKTQLI